MKNILEFSKKLQDEINGTLKHKEHEFSILASIESEINRHLFYHLLNTLINYYDSIIEPKQQILMLIQDNFGAKEDEQN